MIRKNISNRYFFRVVFIQNISYLKLYSFKNTFNFAKVLECTFLVYPDLFSFLITWSSRKHVHVEQFTEGKWHTWYAEVQKYSLQIPVLPISNIHHLRCSVYAVLYVWLLLMCIYSWIVFYSCYCKYVKAFSNFFCIFVQHLSETTVFILSYFRMNRFNVILIKGAIISFCYFSHFPHDQHLSCYRCIGQILYNTDPSTFAWRHNLKN